MTFPEQWPPAAPEPTRPRRSLASGCFGLVAIGGAALASTVPDAWPRALQAGRLVLVGGGGLGLLAGGVWCVRAWRAASRPARYAAAGLVLAAGGAVVWQVVGLWAVVTLCALPPVCGAVIWGVGRRPPQVTESVNPRQEPAWNEQVEADWPGIARAAGLVRPDEEELTAPLLEPPTMPDPACLELLIGCGAVLALPADVTRAAPVLARHLQAPTIQVQGGTDERGWQVARVRAYRRHPIDIRVGWRDVPALDGPTGEWVAVGLDEWGSPALARWRIPWLVAGAQDAGKTALLRAGVRGVVRERIPVRLWLWDNRADFRDMRPIAHQYADGFADGLALVRKLVGVLDERIRQTGPAVAADDTYELRPSLAEPVHLLIVGELLTALEGPPGRAAAAKEIREALPPLLRRLARDGRATAIGTWATAQTTVKEGALEQIRDLFPQKASARLESASLVEPALGSGADQASARPDLIPEVLHGAVVMRDRATRVPYYARSGWIPPADTREALIDPYRELMGRHLTVIEGELAQKRST